MKSFDAAVAHVEEKQSNAGTRVFDASLLKASARRRSILKTSRVDLTIAFFDGFFKSITWYTLNLAVACFDFINFSQLHSQIYLYLVIGQGRKRLVEESPNTTGVYKEAYVMRMTWQKLYKTHYLPYCVKREFKPLSPAKFCACRQQHRPLYKRCRKVSLSFLCCYVFILFSLSNVMSIGVQNLMEPYWVLRVREVASGCGQSKGLRYQEKMWTGAGGPLGAPSWVPR